MFEQEDDRLAKRKNIRWSVVHAERDADIVTVHCIVHARICDGIKSNMDGYSLYKIMSVHVIRLNLKYKNEDIK